MGWALPAAAIGIGALGSISQGYATSAADKATAKIAGYNAQIATQNATFAGEEGEAQAGVQYEKNRQQFGAIKANQGASGVDVNSGSNVNVQASAAELGKLDAMTIRSNAARQAYGYQTQASGFQGQAAVDRSSAKNAVTAGYIGAISGAAKNYALLDSGGSFSDAPWKTASSNNALNSSALSAGGNYWPEGL